MTDIPDLPDFDPQVDEIINREVVEHEVAATDRSLSRRIALQALYEIDSTGHPVHNVLESHIGSDIETRKIRRYVTRLVYGINKDAAELDHVLQEYAPEWPISQVAIVDRNILRIALFEIGVETRTPVGVAIDEAVELAKLFGAEGTARFVNGVLGTIAENLDEVRSHLHLSAEAYEDDPDAPARMTD